ncbi:MAG: hypothetical protein ACJ77V_11505, partial [Chloroflexota bacterium]
MRVDSDDHPQASHDGLGKILADRARGMECEVRRRTEGRPARDQEQDRVRRAQLRRGLRDGRNEPPAALRCRRRPLA